MHTSGNAYTFRVGNHCIKINKIQGKPKQLRSQASLTVKCSSNLGYIVASSCLLSLRSGQHVPASVSRGEMNRLTQSPT